MNFKATNSKSRKTKWTVYICTDLVLLILINYFTDWHSFLKFLLSFPIFINLIFDIFYLIKEKNITELIFDNDTLKLLDNKETISNIKHLNLKYSIRKRKFETNKTEIELKEKKGSKFKTIARLSINNWANIFEIEKELEEKQIQRVKWKSKTLWGKYWGTFIDIFFVVVGGDDIGMTSHQEKTAKEDTQNPIK